MPLQQQIQSFLLRELESLRAELQAYPKESSIWAAPPDLPNSAGTLALHVTGNLQHYIGALLGGSGYIRDRDAEFSLRDLPRSELLEQIAAAEMAIRSVLPRLTREQLAAPFPERFRGLTVETGEFLIQLAVHLGYHLGQISYHRRLVTGNPKGVGALNPARLSSARAADEPPSR